MGALFVAAEGTRRDNGARAPHGREKEILLRPAWNSSAIFNHRRGAPRSRKTRLPASRAFLDSGGQSAHAPPIGRASCRERVCQYVSISVVAGYLKKKNKKK